MPLNVSPLRIPVFVSCPSQLRPDQEKSAQIVLDHLEKNKLQWRALGRPDYPRKLPLEEVIGMIRHCSGGVVLGFEQFHARDVTYRRGIKKHSKKLKDPVHFPTPWNHLEAGILFSLRLPILVFHESTITGGVFDLGIIPDFTHKMPAPHMSKSAREQLDALFQRWAGEVRNHYHAV